MAIAHILNKPFENKHLEDVTDNLDAIMFTGDAFMDKDARTKMYQLLNRWLVRLHEWEEIANAQET